MIDDVPTQFTIIQRWSRKGSWFRNFRFSQLMQCFYRFQNSNKVTAENDANSTSLISKPAVEIMTQRIIFFIFLFVSNSGFQSILTETVKRFTFDLLRSLHVLLVLVETTAESTGLLWAKIDWLVLLTLNKMNSIRTHERDGLSF